MCYITGQVYLLLTRDLYRAKRDLSRACYDYLVSTLRLKQAAGMISLVDLEQVKAG